MLLLSAIRFQKELITALNLASGMQKQTIHSLRYRHFYIGCYFIISFFSEAKCNTHFDTCADMVSYLCKALNFKSNF